MKVAFALVCLALAQGISASIFKRHRPNINVQPLEYINQYQQPLYQPTEYTYQDYIKQLKQQLKKQQKQQHSSSSSQENSQQDSTEWSNVRKYVSIRPSNQKWDKPMFTAVMKIQNDVLEATPYGQKSVWSHVSEMPGTQTNQQQEQEQQWQQQQGQQQQWQQQQWQQQQGQKTQGQQQQEQQQQGQQQKQPLMPNAAQQQEIEQIVAAAQKTMNHPTTEDKLQYQQAVQEAAQVHNEDDHLNATQLLQKYDYAVEEHTVKTEDGYVLTLFRIPPKKVLVRDVSKKPVVFLMHGLLGSADDWLLMGPGKSLGYLLSDAGYDVWLGNARGNKYSHSHVSKHPALNDFWQFSNDEIANHDMPAMINYTLETTGQEKLNYIGHSQGATVFFGLTASKPEYNDKIIKMYALAPMVYMQHARSPLIRMIAPTSQLGKNIHHEIGHGEFKPAKELIATVGGQMLYSEIGAKNLSSNVNVVMAGVNIENLNPEMVPVILGHLPAGTSSRVIKQYGQQVSGGDFRKYDFGPAINQQVYESELPPKYQLENVKVPVTIYYAEEDWLASPVDVTRLQEELPSSVNAYKVQEPHFSHLDFQFSTKAPQLVYKQLIDSMTN